MKKVVLAFVFGLFAVSAQAQTHPCDVLPVNGQTIQTNTPVAIGLCQSSTDTSGASVLITSFRVTIDGNTVFTGPLSPIGAPNSAGLNYYETPKTITVGKGQHAAVSYASSADGESVGSDPFTFTIKGFPPAKGRTQAVIK